MVLVLQRALHFSELTQGLPVASVFEDGRPAGQRGAGFGELSASGLLSVCCQSPLTPVYSYTNQHTYLSVQRPPLAFFLEIDGGSSSTRLRVSILGHVSLHVSSHPYRHHSMLRRLSLAFLIITLAALFCTQSVDAAKGPKITHKVYFDIKHGDEKLGRSSPLVIHTNCTC